MFLLFFVVVFLSSHELRRGPSSGSRHVPHHLLVVHGLEDVVLPRAVVVAGARLDEHHVLLHHLPVGALELHGEGGGSVRGAAAAVQAHAAELGPVGLGGGAAGDLELHGLGDPGGADALFAFLEKEWTDVLEHFFSIKSSTAELVGEGRGGEGGLTRMLCSSWDSHGRTIHSRVCFSRRHSRLSLVTLVEMPRPQLLEQALHSVV